MGYNKKYYQSHREEILAKQHKYYWNDPEKYRNYCREYKKKNREKRFYFSVFFFPFFLFQTTTVPSTATKSTAIPIPINIYSLTI